MSDLPTTPSAPTPLISVRGLGKQYLDGEGAIRVLRAVDLDVQPGEMVAIIGPSGSGKSTLLFVLGLLHPPTTGSYRVAGREVLSLSRSEQAEFRRSWVGFVFQSCNLIENTTVYENLEFPLIYAGVAPQERPARILEALRQVKLDHRIHHAANRLSGGEQQRVAIARALVNRPRIILADEPTGQLDRANGQMVMDHFEQIAKSSNTALLIVTHDMEVAERCTKALHLMDGCLLSGGLQEL